MKHNSMILLQDLGWDVHDVLQTVGSYMAICQQRLHHVGSIVGSELEALNHVAQKEG